MTTCSMEERWAKVAQANRLNEELKVMRKALARMEADAEAGDEPEDIDGQIKLQDEIREKELKWEDLHRTLYPRGGM